jgi:hypothetical protein
MAAYTSFLMHEQSMHMSYEEVGGYCCSEVDAAALLQPPCTDQY